jgi:hypothetical protein
MIAAEDGPLLGARRTPDQYTDRRLEAEYRLLFRLRIARSVFSPNWLGSETSDQPHQSRDHSFSSPCLSCYCTTTGTHQPEHLPIIVSWPAPWIIDSDRRPFRRLTDGKESSREWYSTSTREGGSRLQQQHRFNLRHQSSRPEPVSVHQYSYMILFGACTSLYKPKKPESRQACKVGLFFCKFDIFSAPQAMTSSQYDKSQLKYDKSKLR